MKLLLRFLINAVAIYAAAYLVDGVTLSTENAWGFVIVVIVFGVVNALLKPIAKLLSFPLILLTLGIFTLVINAGLFALTAWLTDALAVSGFWPALWASLVVSIVSWLLGSFVNDDEKETKSSR